MTPYRAADTTAPPCRVVPWHVRWRARCAVWAGRWRHPTASRSYRRCMGGQWVLRGYPLIPGMPEVWGRPCADDGLHRSYSTGDLEGMDAVHMIVVNGVLEHVASQVRGYVVVAEEDWG